MAKRKIKRTIRKATPAERAKLAAAWKEEAAGREANRKAGRVVLKKQQSQTAIANALDRIGQIREAEGISLRQLQKLTGISASNLSRMWTAEEPNVTFKTLERIAEALGRRVRIEFDEPV